MVLCPSLACASSVGSFERYVVLVVPVDGSVGTFATVENPVWDSFAMGIDIENV